MDEVTQRSGEAMKDTRTTTRRALVGAGALATVPFFAKAATAGAQLPTQSPNDPVVIGPATSSRNVITPLSAAVLPLAVKSAGGQSANLQEWQDSSGTPILSVTPSGNIRRHNTGAGHGPMTWSVSVHPFNGTEDPVSYFGYNIGPGGQPIVTGEPYGGIVVEGDYNDGNARAMEMYWEARSADNQINLRPSGFVIKRQAATREEFLVGSAHYGNPYQIMAPRTGGDVVIADFRTNRANFFAPLANDNQISVYAAAGKTSRVVLQCSGADVLQLAAIGPNEAVVSVKNQPLRLYAVNGAAGAAMALNVDDNNAIGTFAVGGASTQSKGVVVRGRASQSANLVEVQSSSAAVLSGFNKDGAFFTSVNAAPSSANIANGQLFLWFDSAQGKLMIKAKDSLGRDRAGSVNLS
jgi:hypothetical protein